MISLVLMAEAFIVLFVGVFLFGVIVVVLSKLGCWKPKKVLVRERRIVYQEVVRPQVVLEPVYLTTWREEGEE